VTSPPAGPRAATSPPATAPAALPDFGVPVRVGRATQVITVKASGSRAVVKAWQKDGDTWKVVRATSGRVGANGVTDGATRRQGTSTTPSGTYTLTEAFGIKADPGTRLPYTRVGADHWWVQDNSSPYYNQMRLGSQGGFDTVSPENAATGSERLSRHAPAYHYAIVIDFNRSPAVRGRGAGIFLHVNGSGATAGCVSVPEADMAWLLRWIDPGRSPVIAIA
jgi:L,D-peptidoglycan transpeptidase YkuD (ErfK/YbiS/YcfS/YnhG family)